MKKLNRFTGLVSGALRILACTAIAMVCASLLIVAASFLVSLGLHPEAFRVVEWLAPLLGVGVGALLAGQWARKRSWVAGFAVGAVTVVLWLIVWLYLMCRWDVRLWVPQGIAGLTMMHLIAWTATLAIALLGGWAGGALAKAKRSLRLGMLLIPLPILAAAVLVSNWMLPKEIKTGGTRQITSGVTMRYIAPDTEGTTARLLTFDFSKNPSLHIGLYDADSDDIVPYDDKNTTFLGQSAGFVFPKLAKQPKSKMICMFNAGFFGWDDKYVGFHVAPITVDGKSRYTFVPRLKDVWTFSIDRSGNKPRFHLVQGLDWKSMAGKYETAIAHVRPLIVDGKPLELKPGAGVTDLRCSRTSIAWSSDSQRLYVLVVRDSDGEVAGIQQWKSGKTQTGGWNLHQVQKFWSKLGAGNALALDGGDSTQMIYRERNGYYLLTSGYLSSRALGYVNQRPLRVFLPVLPVEQGHGGVMNYLYMYEDARD